MIFYISFLLFNLVMCVGNKHLMSRSTLEVADPCSVGLKFATVVNNTSNDDYTVELIPSKCCLNTNDEKCDIIIIYGCDQAEVPKGTTKTLYMIAPLSDPYERSGYCTIFLDYRPTDGDRSIRRESIKIQFDTTLKHDNITGDVKKCKNVDEDPLNDCKPVNCDEHYNGKKNHFNKKRKRCVAPPVCIDNAESDVPDVIYNPITNKCIKGNGVHAKDIEFIKSLSVKGRKAKNIMIIGNKVNDNFKNDVGSKTIKKGKLQINETPIKFNNTMVTSFAFIKCMKGYATTSFILIIVVMIQCFFICMMIYCLTRTCGCGRKKTVIRKFFNYRQDASVTTPLIATSNMDTETTEYQYLSESSNNLDKKIKCYKACQKERKNNMKLSMSDDILSKCLNRRDWHRLPKSETIPEIHNEEVDTIKAFAAIKKPTETKVNFDDLDKTNTVKSIVKKIECSDHGSHNVVSEREIKCHNYNLNARNSNAFKSNRHFSILKQNGTEIDKEAQAYFSNDSIDDFLSERGMMFVGENPSKYSFTSVSTDGRSSVSSGTSRTSKNNMLKNVISFFSRRSRGPLSDPGLKKSKDDLDLELIHMSHASVCSSSNSEYVKSMKRLKDSRSSL